MSSSENTLYKVFHGLNPNDENHIYIVVVLRKILFDLNQLCAYHNHIAYIISYVNAITSKNINMIDEETRHFEEIYLTEDLVFTTHPLELFRTITEKGDLSIQVLRKILYQIYESNLGHVYSFNFINSWLLTVDLNIYHNVAQQIYS